ncbi:hypothetical protein HHI36_002052, partial [Cryptolaemus montrouzieri]
IQDQVMPIKYYRRTILKKNNIRCSNRHNKVTKLIHHALRTKHMNLGKTVLYHTYVRTTCCVQKWQPKDILGQTNNNRHNHSEQHISGMLFVFVKKQAKTTYIVDIAVTLPTNIKKTHADKINKYLPLADETEKM